MASRIIRPASRLLTKYSNTVSNAKLPLWRPCSSISNYNQAILNMPPTRLSTLDCNGIRVVSEDSGAPTATVGLWIDTGSRYEEEKINGAAHFAEHMFFKGTNKRTQTDLEVEVENMGAQLHAYTSREHTVFYSKCFSQDVEKIVELLSDIVQNSKFGEAEIERERGVILREMEEVESDLQEVVFDHLHSTAFQGTALGQTTLGPTQNIKSLTRADLVDYVAANYTGPRMVLAGAGGVDHTNLTHLAEKYFGKIPENHEYTPIMADPCRYTGSEIRIRDDDMPLAHIAVAVKTVGWQHYDNLPLMIANVIIGKWDRTTGGGLNTGVHLARACADGNLAHSYQSFSTTYSDTGLWGIYFVADRLKITNFMYNLQHQWMRLCENITDFEVESAKNQLRTNMMVNLDGTTAICEDIGRQTLCYGRRIPFSELETRLDVIDAEVVKGVCTKYIYDKCPVQVGIGPVEQMPDYNNLRAGMYWLRV